MAAEKRYRRATRVTFLAVAGQALWALREGLEAIHSKWLEMPLIAALDARPLERLC